MTTGPGRSLRTAGQDTAAPADIYVRVRDDRGYRVGRGWVATTGSSSP